MGKNFINKLLPLALTAAMIVPSVPAMAAPSDIAGHWAESVITQWQSKGLIQGYEDGTFKPGNTITRAEFVTLMNNAKGFWSEGSINFSDVKNGSWFYSAVARAVAAGYVKGYSDGSFKPNNTITRAEAAVMIANAARLSANEAGAYRFTDIGSIPAWARGSVGAVVAVGYMTGYPDGIRFTTSVAKNTLETAISNARDAENTGFASQKACKAAADALQVAITAFKGTIKIGTNTTTDAYILQQVKDVVSEDRNSDAPYSSYKQPLKFGYVYKFVDQFNFDNTSLHFAWEAQWKNQSETGNIGDYIEIGKDVRGTNAFYSLGAKVIKAPDEPKEVQFVVTVTDFYNKEIGKLGENGEYTATIGAPISAALQTDAPQFTAISDGTSSSTSATKFTGVVPITLKGADAIKSVPNDCVTMADSNTNVTNNEVSLNSIRVDQVEKSGDVLNVTVTVTTGNIGGVWNENSSVPKFSEGILPNIAIDTSNFQLKENTLGWYLPPDTLKLGDMAVKVLTPAFTGVDLANDPTGPTFTIQTQNMPENATVEVALAKTTVSVADIDNATKKDATRGSDGKYSVTFNKSDFEAGAEYYLWFRYGSPGSDWAYENRTNRPIYTFNNTTGGNTGSESEGGGDASGSTGGGSEGGGSTTEGN